MKDEIKKVIEDRATSILKRHQEFLMDLVHFGIKDFYFAGNGLNNIVDRKTDIDLFFSEKEDFDYMQDICMSKKISNILSTTRNAITLKDNGRIIQMCNYYHSSLEELVESFDYTHIQVGVHVIMDDTGVLINKIYFTDDYLVARSLGNSKYVGGQYPLSSLLRASKYYRYGELSRRKLIDAVISALADILVRGFSSYGDFKDQLDAVDLGLLPEDLKDLTYEKLIIIFNKLCPEENKKENING